MKPSDVKLAAAINRRLIERVRDLLSDNAKLQRRLTRVKGLQKTAVRVAREDALQAAEKQAARAEKERLRSGSKAESEINALRARVKALEIEVKQAKAPRVWVRKAAPAAAATTARSPIEVATEAARAATPRT